MHHGELLINGFFFGGPCDSSVGKQVVRSPYDGRIVGSAAEGGWPELRSSIESAHEAFESWRFSNVELRADLLNRVADSLRQERASLAELLADEIGKPMTQALGEVDRAAIAFRLAANEALNDSEVMPLDSDPRGKDYFATVTRVPRGAVFGIVPYNWPINLAAHKIAPALASGNTFVLKVSPLAPISSLTLARMIQNAGFPPGVLNAWNGPTRDVQKALDHPEVRMVSFTGSAPVGWKIKEQCWNRPVVLECGGDAFAIVCAETDVEAAARRLVTASFAFAGQICISLQHILVHERIYDRFLATFLELTRECVTGNPLNLDTVCGPMISEEAAERTVEAVNEAVDLGAKVLAGGRRTGSLLPPTVVVNVSDGCRLDTEEIFAPVVTIRPFATLDDAIRRVNRSQFGIHASVFSDLAHEIQLCVEQLDVGGVIVNDAPTIRFDNLPYGGQKMSGFGREGIRWAMDSMTDPKSVVRRNLG